MATPEAAAAPTEMFMPEGGSKLAIAGLQKIVREAGKPRGDSSFFSAAFARVDPVEKKISDVCSEAIVVSVSKPSPHSVCP